MVSLIGEDLVVGVQGYVVIGGCDRIEGQREHRRIRQIWWRLGSIFEPVDGGRELKVEHTG